MSKIGFSTKSVEEQQDDNTTLTTQKENYQHVVRFMGIPIFKSTKTHTIDSKVKEK